MLKNVFTLDKMGVQFGVCTASIEQLEFERRREANYKKYNIPSGLFASQNSFYTNDELDAINYIDRGEELPQDLANKLLTTFYSRRGQTDNFNNQNIEKVNEEKIEELLGIKLD